MSEKWLELSIKTDEQTALLTSDFLIENGIEGVFIDKEPAENESNVKAYFDEHKINKDEIINLLDSYFQQLKTDNLNSILYKININPVQNHDWANDWKKYFDTFRVGKYLVFKPLWSEFESKDNDIVINFDPGGFFGSTPHPSTRLCLEEIEDIAKDIDINAKILELGSGSGILSLALYALGKKNITAIDIDPIAISTSEQNFSINNMNIELFLGELKDCKNNFDFIAGNLLAETIKDLSSQIYNKMNKNGVFIGAGITITQEDNLIKIMEETGFRIDNKRYAEEWVLIRASKI